MSNLNSFPCLSLIWFIVNSEEIYKPLFIKFARFFYELQKIRMSVFGRMKDLLDGETKAISENLCETLLECGHAVYLDLAFYNVSVNHFVCIWWKMSRLWRFLCWTTSLMDPASHGSLILTSRMILTNHSPVTNHNT